MSEQYQLSVSWNEYLRNICTGLWALQQKGEFVDMTLAADGHYVKVHKMLMSLASPYIKDLISTTDCAHPVIFLNQISHTTLCLLLEYIYTGEVAVPREHLKSFMEAGQALYIKGLQVVNEGSHQDNYYGDIDLHQTQLSSLDGTFIGNQTRENLMCSLDETDRHLNEIYIDTVDDPEDHHEDKILYKSCEGKRLFASRELKFRQPEDLKSPTTIQYSLSNQGHLQLVLNRYLYNVRYVSRKSKQRKWQCVDSHWKGLKCPALVVTVNNRVLRRSGIHNHPFHDRKILKKMQAGTIFTCINEAQREGKVAQERKDKKNEINITET